MGRLNSSRAKPCSSQNRFRYWHSSSIEWKQNWPSRSRQPALRERQNRTSKQEQESTATADRENQRCPIAQSARHCSKTRQIHRLLFRSNGCESENNYYQHIQKTTAQPCSCRHSIG